MGPPKETWFYVRAPQKFRKKEKFTDRFTLESKSKIDDKLRDVLIDKEHGIMRPGAMPKLQCASAADCKSLLGTVAQAANKHIPFAYSYDIYRYMLYMIFLYFSF